MLKFVRNVESFFEKYIEGFFNKRFTSGLQPIEIAKNLARLMEDERIVGVAQVYVPNHYSVYVSHKEFDRLEPYADAVCNELSAYLTEESRRNGYSMTDSPQIELFADEKLIKQNFRVTASFTDTPYKENVIGSEIKLHTNDTRIFDRLNLTIFEQAPTQFLHGLLTVVEGLDTGLKVGCASGRINIGRRNTNELPLADINTSRLHAYIVYEDNCHVLHDAKSLNGTYVGNHRITHKQLKNGDRIKVGNTVIAYEVK